MFYLPAFAIKKNPQKISFIAVFSPLALPPISFLLLRRLMGISAPFWVTLKVSPRLNGARILEFLLSAAVAGGLLRVTSVQPILMLYSRTWSFYFVLFIAEDFVDVSWRNCGVYLNFLFDQSSKA